MSARIAIPIALFLPISISAQTANTATVSEIVTDSQGARIGQATIKLIDVATNIERVAATDAAGRYHFYTVGAGLLKVYGQRRRVQDQVVNDVQAEVSKGTTVNLTMEAGTIAEVVEVTARVEAQLQED